MAERYVDIMYGIQLHFVFMLLQVFKVSEIILSEYIMI